MKKFISLFAVSAICFSTLTSCAQDKSKRPSPPARVLITTAKGTNISIDYSQPSVKGRTIGKEIATFGEVWRTGANEASVFEISKDVTIAGKSLAAGKYGLYSIPGQKEWTIILNKKSDLWGSDDYNQADDALRFVAKPVKSKAFLEKMTFAINDSGLISLMWGEVQVDFKVDY